MAYGNYASDSLYRNDTNQALLQNVAVRRYDLGGLETDAAIAEQKKREIEEVEVGVREIADCHDELKRLVDADGVKLDNANDVVDDAGVKTREGIHQLQKANETAKQARKRMCCAVVCLLILIGLIVAIVMIVK
ncbi:Syntaxin pep12 [Diplonema papillatum]|nr:Syntaxin pep12 [Diplonema papillatum]